MKSSMARFVAAYRWELLLFLVAPAVARLANDLTSSVFDSYFDSGWLEGRFSYFGHGAVGNLVTAVVLGVCYARVRGLGRELLTLVWGYKLTVSAIFALFWFASAAIVPSFVDPQTDIAAYALVAHRQLDVGIPGAATCAGGVCTAGISAQPHPCVLLVPHHPALCAASPTASPVGVARQLDMGDILLRGVLRCVGR